MLIFNYCVRYKHKGKKDTYHTYNLRDTLANKRSDFNKIYHFQLWFSQLSILSGFDRGNICGVRYHQNYHLSDMQKNILRDYCQRLYDKYFQYRLTNMYLSLILVDIYTYFLKNYGMYGFYANRPDQRWMRFKSR